MKFLDGIKVTTDKYENIGIKKGTKGAIVLAEMRNNSFECELFNVPSDVEMHIIGKDKMEVTRESDISDEVILESLPGKNPNWWCKVEDGYILNLKGERKTKFLMIMTVKKTTYN